MNKIKSFLGSNAENNLIYFVSLSNILRTRENLYMILYKSKTSIFEEVTLKTQLTTQIQPREQHLESKHWRWLVS